MTLPVYFVSLRQTHPGHFASCGWHCAPVGTLAVPEGIDAADALVFDDRVPLPDSQGALTASLLSEASRIGAGVIVLDFERPVTTAARAFAAALSGKHRTAAPERFCAGGCEPIFCYSPSMQTFAEFLNGAHGWIELRPIRETVQYPMELPAPSCEGPDFFSELLQCRYRAKQGADGLTLELFDTPETFLGRARQLGGRFQNAVGLRTELVSFGLTEAFL